MNNDGHLLEKAPSSEENALTVATTGVVALLPSLHFDRLLFILPRPFNQGGCA